MATNVTAAAAHIAYDMQPPESLHRTKYQIKAKKNQDLEHTELEMLITMNVHIPLPNPPVNPGRENSRMGLVSCKNQIQTLFKKKKRADPVANAVYILKVYACCALSFI